MTSELEWIFTWCRAVASGCWEWQRSRRPGGYGMQWLRGRMCRAHHIAFAAGCGLTQNQLDLLKFQFGRGNDDLQIGHRCDNPACINPDHLVLWTGADNKRDMKDKGRAARPVGEQNGSYNGYPGQTERIFELREDGLLRREIAADVGLSNRQVGNILSGKYRA